MPIPAEARASRLPPLDLAGLGDTPLDPLTKGVPSGARLSLGEVGRQGWRLPSGDLPLPAAVIKRTTLEANSRWMAAFAEANGLLLAPHGKTTMAPQLFDLQARDGAWAITLATAQQVEVARAFRVRRVLLANQPAGRGIETIVSAVVEDGMEVHCLADSAAGLEALGAALSRRPPPAENPLGVLVELGFAGGRTGVRTAADALALARRVAETPGMRLSGFECYEGMLPDVPAVDAFLSAVVELAEAGEREGLFPAGAPLVLSAGGSTFFDRVARRFARTSLGRPVLRVLRSGCYLAHDSLGYADAFARIREDAAAALPPGGLAPALEVWAHVQSRPEAEKAIAAMGKRDVGFDAGLPVPLLYRAAGADPHAPPAPMPPGHAVLALNDQHCHLQVPETSPLAFGDMVGFGIGHPCTTFDRWQVLYLVEDDYRVSGAIRTFF